MKVFWGCKTDCKTPVTDNTDFVVDIFDSLGVGGYLPFHHQQPHLLINKGNFSLVPAVANISKLIHYTCQATQPEIIHYSYLLLNKVLFPNKYILLSRLKIIHSFAKQIPYSCPASRPEIIHFSQTTYQTRWPPEKNYDDGDDDENTKRRSKCICLSD